MENKIPIGIVTDSAVDMTDEILNDNHIEVLNYSIIMGGKSYISRVEVHVSDIFKFADEHKELPRTSQITPKGFVDYYTELLNKYERIIYIGLGSHFSGTYNNACLAAKEFPEGAVTPIDSLNLSSGIGLLVLKACKLRDEGKTVEEIAKEVTRCVPLVRTQFAVDTLKYLHMGGRCSGASKLVGSLLNIKPIIRVVNGEMIVAAKPIGYNKALKTVLDYVRRDLDNIDPDNVMITHCLANKDAVYLREELDKFLVCDNLRETFADAIVSTHCGPRTIGILYILKK